MIKLQIIGHLGSDCIQNTVNGKNVINFHVAENEKYRDNQGVEHERTTWVDCAYWTDRTGVVPFLTKGRQVYVEGVPELKMYQKKDGTNAAALTMRVWSVQLLGGSTNGKEDKNNQPVEMSEVAEEGQDLPF